MSRRSARRVKLERFYAKTQPGIGDCLQWVGTLDQDGYGRIMINYQLWLAHRLSYELHNGPIPEGHLVRHTCDNPACVNPKHLLTGTTQDNVDDKMQRGRFKMHERHPMAKLTWDDVHSIRQDIRSLGVLSKVYGVTKANISSIKRNKTWRESVATITET